MSKSGHCPRSKRRRSAARSVVVFGLLLAGCATPLGPSLVPSARPGARGLVLSLQINVLSADGQRMATLPIGDALPRGARYAAKVKAGAPAFLYLIEVSEGGAVRRVVQGSDPPALRVRPGATVNLPVRGAWLEQGARPEQGALVLLASPTQLTAADVRSGAHLPSSQEQALRRDPPPESLPENKRGDVIEVEQSPRALTVARFAFRSPGR